MAVGAAVGGLGGAQIGKGRGQLAATAAGALLGAYAGHLLAQHLNEADRRRAEQAHLESLRTGRTVRWQGTEPGVQGETRVIAESRERKSYAANVDRRVQTLPRVDMISEPYVATARVNVRGGPGTSYPMVDTLETGEQVTVVGKVQRQPWLMIAKGGVIIGYVREDLLRPVPAGTTVRASQPPAGVQPVSHPIEVEEVCREAETVAVLPDGRREHVRSRGCTSPDGLLVHAE